MKDESHRSVKFFSPFIRTVNAIIANFTQTADELKRSNLEGSEYPGTKTQINDDYNFTGKADTSYSRINYQCKNREELKTELSKLKDKSHYEVISPVNDGHDRKGTPLHPLPKKALLEQAIFNDAHDISCHLPNPMSGHFEGRNATAFFKAYKDPEYFDYRYENLAGAIIHGTKGVFEQAIMDFPNEEYRIDMSDFKY